MYSGSGPGDRSQHREISAADHFGFLIASILDFSSHSLWISHCIHFVFLTTPTLDFSLQLHTLYFPITSILDFSSHPLWIYHCIHFVFIITTTLYFPITFILRFDRIFLPYLVPLPARKAPGSQSFQIATNSMSATLQLGATGINFCLLEKFCQRFCQSFKTLSIGFHSGQRLWLDSLYL